MDEAVSFPLKQHSQTMSWKREVRSTSEEPHHQQPGVSLHYLSLLSVQYLMVSRMEDFIRIIGATKTKTVAAVTLLWFMVICPSTAQLLGYDASVSSVSSFTSQGHPNR